MCRIYGVNEKGKKLTKNETETAPRKYTISIIKDSKQRKSINLNAVVARVYVVQRVPLVSQYNVRDFGLHIRLA